MTAPTTLRFENCTTVVQNDAPASRVNLAQLEVKVGRALNDPRGELYIGLWSFARDDMPKLIAAAREQSAACGVAAIHIMSALGDLDEPVTPLCLVEARESLQAALAALTGKTP